MPCVEYCVEVLRGMLDGGHGVVVEVASHQFPCSAVRECCLLIELNSLSVIDAQKEESLTHERTLTLYERSVQGSLDVDQALDAFVVLPFRQGARRFRELLSCCGKCLNRLPQFLIVLKDFDCPEQVRLVLVQLSLVPLFRQNLLDSLDFLHLR